MRWLVLLVLTGCGRIAFDPRVDGSGDGVAADVNTLPSGLLRWYPMDSGANDVASGQDASCSTTECPIATPGHIGNGFLFDGVEIYNRALSPAEIMQLASQ